MFKKTLAAAAVLGAFAGSAFAADVTLYGVIDYGFNYQHVDTDAANTDASDSFRMMSGQNSGSRFGLKAQEDLGNGLQVGFVLENGFDADDGSFDSNGDDKIFGRESQLYLSGAFGTVSFGRVGQMASANGSFGLMGGASPFSGGWQDSVGQKFVFANGFARFDNTVTYVTPEFAGLKVHAQYSFQNSSAEKGTEGKSSVDRYYGVGATYTNNNLYLVGIVDSMNWGTQVGDAGRSLDDQLAVTLGGAYDFGVAKLYASGQYFDNAKGVGQKRATETGAITGGYDFSGLEGAEGWGLNVGVGVPAFGGTAKAQIAYMDAESTRDSDMNVSRWSLAAGYDYNLSKRTMVYTAAAYTRDDVSDQYQTVAATGSNPSTVEVMAGLVHKF
ncbi:porin [Sutterella megalosphaeroides]|uniref:Porin n=1 Tax=Sutterella megalosphaeroides TaxID=2494234 RepID=A0A2Z6IBY6_9BURK|nr:porin [Sutterella megalosphaeroides]BBF24029.1 porin [Sutterella megalosphaeroides]